MGGAVYFVIIIPRPSMSASKTPPMTADWPAALGPALAARTPPVANPERMAFHGSSFFLIAVRVQSNDAKQPAR